MALQWQQRLYRSSQVEIVHAEHHHHRRRTFVAELGVAALVRTAKRWRAYSGRVVVAAVAAADGTAACMRWPAWYPVAWKELVAMLQTGLPSMQPVHPRLDAVLRT